VGRAGDNHVLESEDDLGLQEWVGDVVHETLNDWDESWVSDVSESLQEDESPVVILNAVRLDVLFQMLQEPWEVFLFNDFSVTELSVESDWEARVADSGVHAGLVENGGEGQDGGGQELLVLGTEHIGLQKVL